MKMIVAKSRGLTLIEVLVALVLFAIAMLGVALFMGNALKTSVDDNVRGVALYTATNEMERLVVTGSESGQALYDALRDFDTDDDATTVTRTVVGNSGRDTFTIQIMGARDFNNINVLTDANPSVWRSPVNLGVRVVYDDNEDVSVWASYTVVF